MDARPHDTATARSGSLNYQSPEQVKGTLPSYPSDVYQLGLLLFEMMTGEQGHQHGPRVLTTQEKALTYKAESNPNHMMSPSEQDVEENCRIHLLCIPEYEGWPTASTLSGSLSCRGVLAFNLIRPMLQMDPMARPSITAVLSHPFWWPERKANASDPSTQELLLMRNIRTWIKYYIGSEGNPSDDEKKLSRCTESVSLMPR